MSKVTVRNKLQMDDSGRLLSYNGWFTHLLASFRKKAVGSFIFHYLYLLTKRGK